MALKTISASNTHGMFLASPKFLGASFLAAQSSPAMARWNIAQSVAIRPLLPVASFWFRHVRQVSLVRNRLCLFLTERIRGVRPLNGSSLARPVMSLSIRLTHRSKGRSAYRRRAPELKR